MKKTKEPEGDSYEYRMIWNIRQKNQEDKQALIGILAMFVLSTAYLVYMAWH